MGVFEIKGGPITHKYLMRKTKDDLACELLRELKERLKAEAKNKELEGFLQMLVDGANVQDKPTIRISVTAVERVLKENSDEGRG